MDSDSTIAVTPGVANTTPVAGVLDTTGNFQQKVLIGDSGMPSMRYNNVLLELLLIETQAHTLLLQQLIDQFRSTTQLDY